MVILPFPLEELTPDGLSRVAGEAYSNLLDVLNVKG
jgi:hypothetical protein